MVMAVNSLAFLMGFPVACKKSPRHLRSVGKPVVAGGGDKDESDHSGQWAPFFRLAC
jgi:hypothetical protein